jgi:hypothetical protein
MLRIGQAAVQAHDPLAVAVPAPSVPYNPAAARGAPDCLESVLHALLGVLGMRGRSVSFELATGTCRFEVVGWVEGVTSREYRAVLARARFESVYGPVARDWRIELAEGGYQCGALAVAVPGNLLSSILGACGRAGVQSGAIRPAAGACIDRMLRKSSKRAAWIVVADGTDVFLGLVNRGSWLAARCMPMRPEGLLAGVADVLARETALVADELSDVHVLACIAPASKGGIGQAASLTPSAQRVLESGDLRWPLEWMDA